MLAAVVHATHKVGDPLAFYSVAATIIPVLFLALLFQANLLERSPVVLPGDATPGGRAKHRNKLQRLIAAPVVDDIFAVFFALYLLAITAIGEYVCLHALLIQEAPGKEGKHLAGLSIYASSLTLLFQQLALALGARRKARGDAENVAAGRVGIAGTVAYFIALAAGGALILQ
jgi:hypothetical protein